MAMFGSRPEEPAEWAGLPSEPLEEDEFTRLLPAAPTAPGADVFGLAAPESIAISLAAIPLASPTESEDSSPPAADE